ncbi:hypothetical protein [Enterococcus ratti]|nr:hypothetical protein [Enterococcus ratti]
MEKLIEEQGLDAAFASLATNFYDEKTITFIMKNLELPPWIDRQQKTSQLIKNNKTNIGMRELEVESFNDLIKEHGEATAFKFLANGFHDAETIAFIMKKLELPPSIDRQKATNRLIQKNKTLREEIIENFNQILAEKGCNDLLKGHNTDNDFTVICNGRRDAKGIKSIIDHLNLPESINRIELANKFIKTNRICLALVYKLNPMLEKLCDKQAIDSVFKQMQLPEHIEKEFYPIIIKKALAQHQLDVEKYQENYKNEIRIQKKIAYAKALQNEIKRDPNSIYFKKLQAQEQSTNHVSVRQQKKISDRNH